MSAPQSPARNHGIATFLTASVLAISVAAGLFGPTHAACARELWEQQVIRSRGGVVAELSYGGMTGTGYIPCRARISAPVSAVDRTFRLRFRPIQAYFSRGRVLMVERTITLPAGESTVATEWPLPDVDVADNLWGGGARVSLLEGNRSLGDTYFSSANNMVAAGTAVDRPRILRIGGTEPVLGKFFPASEDQPLYGPALPPATEANPDEESDSDGEIEPEASNVAVAQPDELPLHWQSYTNFDTVFCDGERLPALSETNPTAAAALRRWVAAGGHLLVCCQPEEVPAVERQLDLHAADLQPSESAEHRQYRVKWGTVDIWEKPIDQFSRVSGRQLFTARSSAPGEWQVAAGEPEDFQVYRVPGVGELSLWFVVGMITVFMIVIGPVNLFWINRVRRQYLIMLTVPAMALAVCIVVLGYAMFRDGFSVRGRIWSVTLLDQSQGHAWSCSRQAFYPGMILQRRLTYPGDAVVTPCFETGFTSAPNTRNARWEVADEAQVLWGSWLSSRTHSQFNVVEDHATERRLEIQTDGETITVTNRLGTTVVTGVLREGDRIFVVKDLAPGETVELTPASTAQAAAAIDTIARDPADSVTFDFRQTATRTASRETVREAALSRLRRLSTEAMEDRTYIVHVDRPVGVTIGTDMIEVDCHYTIIGRW